MYVCESPHWYEPPVLSWYVNLTNVYFLIIRSRMLCLSFAYHQGALFI